MKLVYSSKTEKTKVTIKEKDRQEINEEFPGIRILKLTTENGTLKYSY